MVRWLRWHCPPDTGFEIRALAVWGRARYLSVTKLPTILTFTRGWGRNNFVSFKPPRPGTEARTLAWKAAVLTTTLGPPPLVWCKWNESGFRPPLCTYRLNWARKTSRGWWDDWDDTVLQTHDSKFEHERPSTLPLGHGGSPQFGMICGSWLR